LQRDTYSNVIDQATMVGSGRQYVVTVVAYIPNALPAVNLQGEVHSTLGATLNRAIQPIDGVFDANGVVLFQYSPTVSGAYVLSLTVDRSLVAGAAPTMQVNPAGADAARSTMLDLTVSTVSVGTLTTFKFTNKDRFGNTINTENFSSIPTLTLVSAPRWNEATNQADQAATSDLSRLSSLAAVEATLEGWFVSFANSVYTISMATRTAGTMTVRVQTVAGTAITGSPVMKTVIPATAAPANSLLYGRGIILAIRGLSNEVIIVPRDIYGNAPATADLTAVHSDTTLIITAQGERNFVAYTATYLLNVPDTQNDTTFQAYLSGVIVTRGCV
jgi:hypothetical protein